jgi:hypothetical protein
MPLLPSYHHFAGRHRETGAICNALAYQGVKAPHTGQPYSEALLLGASGGVAFGYFTFDYAGNDPILALLTRSTFDPMQTIFERLGIAQDIHHTADPKKGEANLVDALENGRPALVWADVFSLPYNALSAGKGWWDMQPVVVFGYESGQAHIADRSQAPLVVSAAELAQARALIKKDKYRVVTLDPPDPRKLVSAVHKGIWQCLSLYTEAPPHGARYNFGLAAFRHWADMLTNTRNKASWERFFPPGSRLYAALAGAPGHPGAFGWIQTYGAAPGAERGLYADFLDEAALILEKPGLLLAAEEFRASALAWHDLAAALLPDAVPLLEESRHLLQRRHTLFIEQGAARLDEIHQIDTRLAEIKAAASQSFPLTPSETAALRSDLSRRVLHIHDLERQAVETLQSAMNGGHG